MFDRELYLQRSLNQAKTERYRNPHDPQEHTSQRKAAMFVLVISSFAGFLGTNSRKNWPISQEFSGQTSPKSNQ